MGKVVFFLIIEFLLFGAALANPNVNSFIPRGWQAGNGFKDYLNPFYVKANIDQDDNKEIILHYSRKGKDEYWPDKHVISFLSFNGKKYTEKWRKRFDSMENIFFLVEDINNDRKKELVVHGMHSGNAAYGHLWVFQLSKTGLINILDKAAQGEMYLWDANKQRSGICPDYFPDLNKDGIKEIIMGRQAEDERFCHVDQPWWFDIYKWDGHKYCLADDQFPGFYKEELADYLPFIKEKGEDSLLREYVARARTFAGLKEE